jgi:hypothetical protein
MKKEFLKLPYTTVYGLGAHVGRFSSAVIVAAIPDHPLLVLSEIPNYHYVGDGEIELAGVTSVEWAELVVREWDFYAHDQPCLAWVDPDTEFAREVARSKLRLRRNLRHGPELRTEILREYFLERKIFFAPWLSILPAEIAAARWPDESAASYQIRATGKDFSLNALEMVVSRRPKASAVDNPAPNTWLARQQLERGLTTTKSDAHLGKL